MKLNKVPYLPTEQDLTSLPRVVAIAISNYSRAFGYYSKHAKMMKFYRAINGTGMKPEDQIAMDRAQVNKNRAEAEMWSAFDEKEAICRAFDADPDKFWRDEQAADEANAIDGIHYVDECAELRAGM